MPPRSRCPGGSVPGYDLPRIGGFSASTTRSCGRRDVGAGIADIPRAAIAVTVHLLSPIQPRRPTMCYAETARSGRGSIAGHAGIGAFLRDGRAAYLQGTLWCGHRRHRRRFAGDQMSAMNLAGVLPGPTGASSSSDCSRAQRLLHGVPLLRHARWADASDSPRVTAPAVRSKWWRCYAPLSSGPTKRYRCGHPRGPRGSSWLFVAPVVDTTVPRRQIMQYVCRAGR